MRSNDPAALEKAIGCLPLGWQSEPAGEVDFLYSLRLAPPADRPGRRNFHLLYCGPNLITRTLNSEVLWSALEKHTELVTAFHAKGLLFVHAGVVGWQGQAILIPGRSMAGKSTLVKALVEAGAVYYSDEFALLDRDGRVHPYPAPLSIRSSNGLSASKVSPASLGAQVGADPIPVGLVVETAYEPDAEWRPSELTPGLALLALMTNTVAARREPDHSMPVLKKVVTGSVAVNSKRGEAADVAPRLLALLE